MSVVTHNNRKESEKLYKDLFRKMKLSAGSKMITIMKNLKKHIQTARELTLMGGFQSCKGSLILITLIQVHCFS